MKLSRSQADQVTHEFWMIIFANWTVDELVLLDRDAWGYSVKA